MPFEFNHSIPPIIDMRVMFAYLELYQQQLMFTNYKLYTDSGLLYPPDTGASLEASGPALLATGATADQTGAVVPRDVLSVAIEAQKNDTQVEATVDPEDESIEDDIPEVQMMREKQEREAKYGSLFCSCVFFLSREVPRDVLMLIIRSFGGRVGWAHSDSSPFTESDPRITHQIIDRPVQENMYQGRVYVQPQWVFDSVNQLALVAAEAYAPGAELPPHLSPFVSATEYKDPKYDIPTVDEEEKHLAELAEVDKYESKENKEEIVKEKEAKEKKRVNYTEKQQLAMSMMTKKKRGLYIAMRKGIALKQSKTRQ
jgi:pescadillo protein